MVAFIIAILASNNYKKNVVIDSINIESLSEKDPNSLTDANKQYLSLLSCINIFINIIKWMTIIQAISVILIFLDNRKKKNQKNQRKGAKGGRGAGRGGRGGGGRGGGGRGGGGRGGGGRGGGGRGGGGIIPPFPKVKMSLGGGGGGKAQIFIVIGKLIAMIFLYIGLITIWLLRVIFAILIKIILPLFIQYLPLFIQYIPLLMKLASLTLTVFFYMYLVKTIQQLVSFNSAISPTEILPTVYKYLSLFVFIGLVSSISYIMFFIDNLGSGGGKGVKGGGAKTMKDRMKKAANKAAKNMDDGDLEAMMGGGNMDDGNMDNNNMDNNNMDEMGRGRNPMMNPMMNRMNPMMMNPMMMGMSGGMGSMGNVGRMMNNRGIGGRPPSNDALSKMRQKIAKLDKRRNSWVGF